MHLEISAGGLSGFVSVHSYQSSMKRYISDADKIISSFKTVQTSTRNVTNGVGNLSGALSDITTRVRNEETRKRDAEFIQRESTSFLELARQVDERVAAKVNQNREQFYRDYPHLRPSFFHDAKKFFGDVWDWLRSATKTVADVIRTIKSSIGEFVAKIVKSNVFTKIAATIALVALAALAIFSFPALLAAVGIAGVAATILTAVFAVSTAVGAILNVYSVWGNIAEHPVLQKIQIIANTLSFGMVLVLTLGTGGTVISTVYAVSKIVTEITNVIDAFVVIDNEFYDFLKDAALVISTATGIYLTGKKVADNKDTIRKVIKNPKIISDKIIENLKKTIDDIRIWRQNRQILRQLRKESKLWDIDQEQVFPDGTPKTTGEVNPLTGKNNPLTAKSHLLDTGVVLRNGRVSGTHNLDKLRSLVAEHNRLYPDKQITLFDKSGELTPHPNIKGIYDCKYECNGQTFTKTVFDPREISPDKIAKWAESAVKKPSAVTKTLTDGTRTVKGTAPNGLQFDIIVDRNGVIKSIYPVLP